MQVVHYARPDAVRLPTLGSSTEDVPERKVNHEETRRVHRRGTGRRRRRTGTGGDGRPQRRRLPRRPQGHLRHDVQSPAQAIDFGHKICNDLVAGFDRQLIIDNTAKSGDPDLDPAQASGMVDVAQRHYCP
ncbi:MAG: DUF732 domain-containing protein [Mycobacterium sp.]